VVILVTLAVEAVVGVEAGQGENREGCEGECGQGGEVAVAGPGDGQAGVGDAEGGDAVDGGGRDRGGVVLGVGVPAQDELPGGGGPDVAV